MLKYVKPNNQAARPHEPRHTKAKARHVTSIGELLTIAPVLRQRAELARGKQSLLDWLKGRLGTELAIHALAAEMKADTLIVAADTAAWSTRLRYAMAALQPQVSAQWPKITACQVRVRPSRRS
jgi:predicted nucleic acid-binding Zn ribbon protein